MSNVWQRNHRGLVNLPFPDPCASVTCGANFVCTAGTCLCGGVACGSTANVCNANVCECGGTGAACTVGATLDTCLTTTGTVDTTGNDAAATCQVDSYN